jgi:hypothetical protein
MFLLEPEGREAAWASFTIWILLSFKLNNALCLRRLIGNFNNKKPWLKRIWSATQAGTYVLYMKLTPSVQDLNPVGPGTSWTGRIPELSSRVRIRSFGQCCGPLNILVRISDPSIRASDLWILDQDPANIFVIDLQDVNKKLLFLNFSAYFFLKVHYIIFQR